MDRFEFVAMADGIDTGYRDHDGKPIHVGDEVIYYKKQTKRFWDAEKGKWCWDYTGRVTRRRHKVKYDFLHGLKILENNQWKFLFETDEEGNLLTILVDNEHRNPKLNFMQVLGKRGPRESGPAEELGGVT